MGSLHVELEIGRNLNAFNDVLYGGFGVHDVDEKYILKWHGSEKKQIGIKILRQNN